ncbi:hypothetical protein Val02_10530 [Virgisporangium aliadipatigenens]|uniref:DUF1963 domain-containing protein n=1 Tax=Virgisporangium aliadipatigenens TaxID=741659 RepID=A0A8J3YH60_9ACTN|nr:hypothetical protein [Virgisporangium aliadipatigenens]GIJ44167.1 hypothetical protein Val02_10530 [Virgisporangium aliadipatigenens]
MSRTTPPRPFDITAVFPELREHSATATRLHPRPGAPTAADSSIGGPLRWPADEPWPHCEEGDLHYAHRVLTPSTVRRMRRIYAAAQARADATGTRYAPTAEERAQLPDPTFSEPHGLLEQPIPYVPVAQLYRRDIPDFAGPDGTDLLQVLWCPLDHPEDQYCPRIRLYWRRVADLGPVLTEVPEPPVVNDSYLPVPCAVHPERILEHRNDGMLPDGLDARIRAWEKESGLRYHADLSLAPGWKVGGFAHWGLTDWYAVTCKECGTSMTLLLTVASFEWNGTGGTWRPIEEPAGAGSNPTRVVIGRGYDLFVFRCPESFDHPHATAMQ